MITIGVNLQIYHIYPLLPECKEKKQVEWRPIYELPYFNFFFPFIVHYGRRKFTLTIVT